MTSSIRSVGRLSRYRAVHPDRGPWPLRHNMTVAVARRFGCELLTGAISDWPAPDLGTTITTA